MIGNDLLDHAGARSVDDPRIERDASSFSRALNDLVFGEGERAADLIGTPGTGAERALHALATGDQDAFWTGPFSPDRGVRTPERHPR